MPNKNLLRLDVDYSCQPVFWDQWNPKRRNSASDGMNQGAIETQLEPNVIISCQQIARIIPLNKNDISHFHL